MKRKIIAFLPDPVIRVYRGLKLGFLKSKLTQYKRVRKIRRENNAKVVFIVSVLPMWRSQDVFNFLRRDKRFNVSIVFCPFASYTASEKQNSFLQLKDFFDRLGIPMYDASNDREAERIANELDPDIIFYPQFYNRIFNNCWDFEFFKDRLLCYVPYGLGTLNVKWNYQTDFHTIAWRSYYATDIHKANARKCSLEFGLNVRVVGDAHADEFGKETLTDSWPKNGKKRIIYSPHFQIFPNEMFYRPSFLWTYDIMLEIAREYPDKLQIVFKPHPRLYTALCKHPEWGEERTREYYHQWELLPNTQIENGGFVDLFKSSDALIHDCGSFTAEYMYTKKPCLFLTRDEESVRKDLCRFGTKCFNNHYVGSNKEDILNFINNVVIGGDDPKMAQRADFFSNYLLPPNGKSCAENIYEDLVNSLF